MEGREGEWEAEKKGKGRQRKRGKEGMERKQKPCSDLFLEQFCSGKWQEFPSHGEAFGETIVQHLRKFLHPNGAHKTPLEALPLFIFCLQTPVCHVLFLALMSPSRDGKANSLASSLWNQSTKWGHLFFQEVRDVSFTFV